MDTLTTDLQKIGVRTPSPVCISMQNVANIDVFSNVKGIETGENLAVDGGRADIGIGNQPQNTPDWTFSASAGNYPIKRLRVLVRCR